MDAGGRPLGPGAAGTASMLPSFRATVERRGVIPGLVGLVRLVGLLLASMGDLCPDMAVPQSFY